MIRVIESGIREESCRQYDLLFGRVPPFTYMVALYRVDGEWQEPIFFDALHATEGRRQLNQYLAVEVSGVIEDLALHIKMATIAPPGRTDIEG